MSERIVSDGGNAIGDDYSVQAGAAKERTSLDGDNAVGNYDVGQTGITVKRLISNNRNCQSIKCIGDGDIAAGAGVAGDGAGAVAVVGPGVIFGRSCTREN